MKDSQLCEWKELLSISGTNPDGNADAETDRFLLPPPGGTAGSGRTKRILWN